MLEFAIRELLINDVSVYARTADRISINITPLDPDTAADERVLILIGEINNNLHKDDTGTVQNMEMEILSISPDYTTAETLAELVKDVLNNYSGSTSISGHTIDLHHVFCDNHTTEYDPEWQQHIRIGNYRAIGTVTNV